MKKKIIIIVTLLLITSGLLHIQQNNILNEENVQKTVPEQKQNKILSMMLETDYGSGNYKMASMDSWPTEGYIFNKDLSKCENGGKLFWDNTNKKVIMKGNISDKCYVYFDKYDQIDINDYSINPSGNKINIIINASCKSSNIVKYYFSMNDGITYTESTTNTYTFSELGNGTYKIKAYAESANGSKSEIISKEINIFIVNLIDYVKSQYTGTQGENGLYYHDTSLTNGAEDNSYRYAGFDPNNYICFGSDDATCPETNLYRIVGIFGEENHGITGKELIKVMKYTLYGTYAWHDTAQMGWSGSALETRLNSIFITEVIGDYADKIVEIKWKEQIYTSDELTAKKFYDVEIQNAKNKYSAKIGLTYPSEYGFATTQDYWKTALIKYENEACNSDWMYKSDETQWTLANVSMLSPYAWTIYSSGSLGASTMTGKFQVHPAFFIDSSINYASGTGLKSDPIRLS